MGDWLESLSARVAVPECFSLLTHDTETVFRIVEAKDVPERTPIICSPATTFFHKILVDHLQTCGAEIRDARPVHLFRKSTGFSSDSYCTLTVPARWPFREMMSDDFRPAMINLVDEVSVVFFSREYYQRVTAETDLTFLESPTIYLVPIGYD